MKLVFTPSANADLASIAGWIAEDSPQRSLSFVSELRVSCGVLPEMPRAFPLVPRYESVGLRRMAHGKYLVFYRIAGEQVEVVRVLNGARDYEAILFPEG